MRPGGGAADAKRPFVTARKASLSPWTGCDKMENRVKTKKSPPPVDSGGFFDLSKQTRDPLSIMYVKN